MPVHGHADRDVDGPVGDLPVANLEWGHLPLAGRIASMNSAGYTGSSGRTGHAVISASTLSVGAPPCTQCSGESC